MSLQDLIRARIEAALARHQRGEPTSPDDGGDADDPGIEFRDLPSSTLSILRMAFVECTECHSPVVRDSTDEHARWHLALARDVVGPGPRSGAFVAPGFMQADGAGPEK